MQDRIYRFLIKRSVRGGVFEAEDTVTQAQVLLYEWTPLVDQRTEARARLAGLAESLDAEVFSADASLYLVAANDEQAGRALEALTRAGLFPGHWAGEAQPQRAPARTPPPPPPPLPTSPPPAGPAAKVRPAATATATATKTKNDARGTPTPVRVPRWPGSLLKAGLLALLLAAVAIAAALYRDRVETPSAALAPPRLTIEPRIAHPGERVTLNWSTSGYDRVQLDGQRIDNAGNRVVTASASRIFRLVAIAADGRTATADARLIVTPARTSATKPKAGAPVDP